MTGNRAGWAQIDATPPLGLPMGGRGPRFTPGGEVLDPLAAQVVVLEDAKGARTLWMSIDMIGMTWHETSGFRHELSALTGIPFEAIVINFSHTHSGPMSGFVGYATTKEKPAELQAYEDDLIARCTRMTLEALDRMAEVTVTVGRGASEIGINRRLRGPDGTMGMGPNPDGFYNPDLWVMDLREVAGDGRCVLFNYGCHPVMVYGFAWDGISADWPGACRRHLTGKLGSETQAQFIQGLAGNVRPRCLAELDDGTFRKSTARDVTATGAEIGDDVLAAIDRGASVTLDLHAASTFAMAPRDTGNVPDLDHWDTLAKSDQELDQNLGAYWGRRLRSGIPPVKVLPWAVGLMQVAPGHRIAWLANEVLAEWLPLLRHWTGDPNLVAWGYCQDGRNYMPTDDLIHEGGYEVDRANTYSKNGPGPVAVGINDAVRGAFDRLKRQIGD